MIVDGKVVEVVEDIFVFDGVIVIDVSGKWVMLGIIDNYFYFGVYLSLSVSVYGDGNEISVVVIVEVWVEYGIWF